MKGKDQSDYKYKAQQQEQLGNLSTIHEKPLGLNTSSDFTNKFNDDKQYNTLFINKNCASCTGFAPTILS